MIVTNVFDVKSSLLTRHKRLKDKWIYTILDGFHCLDADTIVVVRRLGVGLFSIVSLRVNGIDAPEVHSRSDSEKRAGLLVTEVAHRWISLIPKDQLEIIEEGSGKYVGRVLGTIGNGLGGTLTQFLLENKLVKPYDGGTKSPWTEADLLAVHRRAEELLKAMPSASPDHGWVMPAIQKFIDETVEG